MKNNREAGIIVEMEEIASYYAEVFFYDWYLQPPEPVRQGITWEAYKSHILVVLIYGFTFALVIRDWRKREWNS